MQRRTFVLALSLAPLAALAQASTAADFDFLVGEWSLVVRPKVSGLAAWIHGTPTLVGTWKAWRVDGGIDDEQRIVDASGNPRSTLRAQRRYDAASGRWSIATTDAYHARNGAATARREGDDVRVDGSYTSDGATVLTRTRWFDIARDAFRLRQDRSRDGGTTWEDGAIEIDATRVAAAPTP